MSEPGFPELRASDADRERAADVLRRAAGEGRLTMEELDERLHAAYATRTRRELERLLADVVEPGSEHPPAAGHRIPVRRGEGGTRWIVAVLGGGDRKGAWRLSERCVALNVMGGSDLDLNDAELAAERVELTVFSFMGGSKIRIPEGLNVEVSDFAFMGGNDVDVGNARPDPGGPVVHVRLISIMGGTDVRRGRRPPRRGRHHLGHA
jgi:hypothetical protein